MSSPQNLSVFIDNGQYVEKKAHLRVSVSEKSDSDSGSQTDISGEHSKNVTRWASTESLQSTLPAAEDFVETKQLRLAAPPNAKIENAFIVEALIASDIFEQITQFCTHQDITPNESLVLAFHAFHVRTTDNEREQVYTTHARHGSRRSLKLASDLPVNFSLLAQDMKLAPIELVDDSRNNLNYNTRSFHSSLVKSYDVIQAGDLELECIECLDSGLTIRLISPQENFDIGERQRFIDNLTNFWSLVVAYPFYPLMELPICSQQEIFVQKQHYWSSITTPNSWDQEAVIDRIFRIAKEVPQATAIITSEGEVLTYDLLIHRSCIIAASLKQSGVCPGDLVGLLASPGLDEVIGMIAILLNRCGYVAMDPTFTTERLSFMANDSKMPIILVAPDLAHMALEVVSKSYASPRILEFPDSYLGTSSFDRPHPSPHDPFYTVYTSGSTGQPKGVVLTQSNTQQMLSTLHQDYHFSRFDRFLHHSSMCFDLSIVEIFSALTCGATVCVASAQTKVDPEALGLFMKQVSITVTYFTPTKFALLLEACPEHLQKCQEYRVAFFAGERLPVRVAERFYGLQLRAIMYNTWSPSELVVQTAIYQVPRDTSQIKSNIPIGFPMANSAHYVVDSNLHLVPVGMIGEICVGGAQVGRGYINTPGGKCKAFIENPFATPDYIRHGWSRLFRTGDKGRFLPNGELEFHGRIAGDKQIKLRGLRIDLGEVEQKVFEVAKIASKVTSLIDVNVTARPFQHQNQKESMTDDRQLIAFLVPQSSLSIEERQNFVNSLHYELQIHLNEYMLPNGYEILEGLPMTIGGKVDIRNLQSRPLHPLFPPAKIQQKPVGAIIVADPKSDPVLSSVIDHFRTLLSLGEDRTITLDDNLFALGGNSMLVLVLQAKLKTTFKVKIPVSSLFKETTPAAVARLVREKQMGTPKKGQAVQAPGEVQIDWQLETTLPPSQAFIAPQSPTPRHRSEISTILVTGADSFIGIHFIATILAAAPTTVIYILGSSHPITLVDLKISLGRYQLINNACGDLSQRVIPLSGTLAEPEFGLGHADFKALGEKIHAIYHIGGEVSLLKSYYDLKAVNVSSALTLISLAHYGTHLTELHYLSTWSIPHLQNWHSTQRTRRSLTAAEESAHHFTPSASPSTGGYLKARWATEMLLTQASERGFHISVYRSSAITGSSATKVPEPMYDLYRYAIMRMIQTRSIPDKFASESPLPFTIDFIPVDYLASTIFALSASPVVNGGAEDKLSIYHIGNPSPLSISGLLPLIPSILPDGISENKVKVLPFEEWLAAIANKTAAGDDLRVAALNGMFSLGHVPFPLDRKKTAAALALISKTENREGKIICSCPPVAVKYLQEMLKSSW